MPLAGARAPEVPEALLHLDCPISPVAALPNPLRRPMGAERAEEVQGAALELLLPLLLLIMAVVVGAVMAARSHLPMTTPTDHLLVVVVVGVVGAVVVMAGVMGVEGVAVAMIPAFQTKRS